MQLDNTSIAMRKSNNGFASFKKFPLITAKISISIRLEISFELKNGLQEGDPWTEYVNDEQGAIHP